MANSLQPSRTRTTSRTRRCWSGSAAGLTRRRSTSTPSTRNWRRCGDDGRRERIAATGQRGDPGNVLTRSCRGRETTVGKKARRATEQIEASDPSPPDGKLKRKEYEAKLDVLHMELVKMQYW